MINTVRISTIVFHDDRNALEEMARVDQCSPNAKLRELVRKEAIRRNLLLPGPASELPAEAAEEARGNPWDYRPDDLLRFSPEALEGAWAMDSIGYFRLILDRGWAEKRRQQKSLWHRLASLGRKQAPAQEEEPKKTEMAYLGATVLEREYKAMVEMATADSREVRDELRYLLQKEAVRRGLRQPHPAGEYQANLREAANAPKLPAEVNVEIDVARLRGAQ